MAPLPGGFARVRRIPTRRFPEPQRAEQAAGAAAGERLRPAGLRQNNFGSRISDFGFPPEAALSPATLGLDWVTLERSTVGKGNLPFRDPSNAGRRFIPLLLADCKLPDTLRRYKYVDYRQEAEAGIDELLTACRAFVIDRPADQVLRDIRVDQTTAGELAGSLEADDSRVALIKVVGHTDDRVSVGFWWTRPLTESQEDEILGKFRAEIRTRSS